MAQTKPQRRTFCPTWLLLTAAVSLIQSISARSASASSSFSIGSTRAPVEGIRLSHRKRQLAWEGERSSIRAAFSPREEDSYWRQTETAHRYPNEHDADSDEYDALLDQVKFASTIATERSSGLHVAVKNEYAVQPVSSQVLTSPAAKNNDNKAWSAAEASTRGGAASILAATARPLVFWENMVCGAVSRSIAQTVMHPANTMKTILQSSRGADRPTFKSLAQPAQFKTLTRGAGANFILSVPHGAINFAVLEMIRGRVQKLVEDTPILSRNAERLGPGLDFLSSSISTICCSVVSTPQMMITDNIMAGNYPDLPSAVVGLSKSGGIKGFYAGWWPGLAGKIPSYALTWTIFQQLKLAQLRIMQRPPKDVENSIMGCIASATTVCIMIPMDTVKTRLVTQTSRIVSDPYNGIADCFVRVLKEEGIGAFYRGLAPRLISVVPMIGIQFGVYEFAKKVMMQRSVDIDIAREKKLAEAENLYGFEEKIEEAAMEVAADQDQPFPAPHFKRKYRLFQKNDKKKNGIFKKVK